jgi:AcrR family transcriptional regulator
MLIFWRQGYEGTSIADLTRELDVNAPSLYAAFGSKEELFRKVVARYIEKPASYLPNALKEPTARRVVEKLFDGAINMVMQRGNPDGCLLVHGALAAGPQAGFAREQLSRCRAGAEAAIRRRFEQAKVEGDLPKRTDAAKLAAYVITVIWGMSVQAAGGATRGQLEQVAQQALQAWPK